MNRRLAAALVSVFLPIQGIALEHTATKITRVGTTNTDDAVLIETETTPTSSCSTSRKIIMPKNATSLFAENLSILLSAFHADAMVRLYTEGCVDGHIAFKSVSLTK